MNETLERRAAAEFERWWTERCGDFPGGDRNEVKGRLRIGFMAGFDTAVTFVNRAIYDPEDRGNYSATR